MVKRVVPRPRLHTSWVIAFTAILAVCLGNQYCPAKSSDFVDSEISSQDGRQISRSDPVPSGTVKKYSTTGSQLFDYAIHLLRRNYVNEIPDTLLFDFPLKRMTMTLLPHCVEDIPNIAECSEERERCFGQSIRSIAARCNIRQELLFEIALKLILRQLDPNTGLLDESMLKEIKISTSGRFGGVGLVVASREGNYVVVSPFEGSPAHKAGITPGEIVLEIDGQSVQGLPLSEVLAKVRGPAGSIIAFTLKDPKSDKIRHIRLRRKEIVVPPVRYGMPAEGIGYLRLVNFQESTYADTLQALKLMIAQNGRPLKGLVLDLRDNPGGLFDQAIQVAELFVSSGVITSLRGHNQQFNREFRSNSRSMVPRVPIVVLINNGTASASEILAGALKGKPGVVLMGKRTFGKASVQAVFPLGKGSALRLTTAHYYTADGEDIEGKGLDPGVKLETPEDNRQEGTVDPLAAERLDTDYSLMRAIEYIRSSQLPHRTFESLF
jgi:carboxyl-terminal processing protease